VKTPRLRPQAGGFHFPHPVPKPDMRTGYEEPDMGTERFFARCSDEPVVLRASVPLRAETAGV